MDLPAPDGTAPVTAPGGTAPLTEPGPAARFVELDEADGRTRWVVDAGFLSSGWRCLWGDGCQGIADVPTPHLHQGCCSVGVVLADEEEAMTVAALADTLPPELFQHRDDAAANGAVARHGERWSTRVVDGACIFFNAVGFPGGKGCALHHSALADGADPIDYKPWTCSKLPLRTEDRVTADGTVEVTLRAWRRDDWGPGGATMAWWCTEAAEAFDAPTPLAHRAAPQLRRMMGDELYARLRQEIDARLTGDSDAAGSGPGHH